MLGPWRDDSEVLECMMYWQKRALKAEKEVEEALDDYEYMVKIILEERAEHEDQYKILEDMYNNVAVDASYYKQQFLDKDKEIAILIKEINRLRELLYFAHFGPEDSGTEESDDPWKYRS